MHAKQRAFVEDEARFKAADCGRRSGKTFAVGGMMFKEALKHPGSFNPYIALTKEHARNLIWEPIKEMNRIFGINATPNETRMMLTLHNGARIKLTGADKEKDVEKLRGVPIAIAAIDEAAFFGIELLQYLLDKVLRPATMDYRGKIIQVGSPANHCSGPFFDACTKDNKWSHHNFTILDNTYIPHAREELDEVMEEKGWTEESPSFLLEYMGKWVHDASLMVYHFKNSRNGYSHEPEQDWDWEHVLGVDLGYTDDAAFTVCSFAEQSPEIHIQESFKHKEMIPSQIAETIERLMRKYGSFNRIVVDTGGLGRSIVEEFAQRHRIPAVAAKKTAKGDYIKMMNDDFINGRIKVHRAGATQLIGEYRLLQWQDESREKEHDRFDNHCADSALYAWRESLHWTHEAPPSPKTEEEQMQSEADHMEDQELKELERENNEEWWGDPWGEQ